MVRVRAAFHLFAAAALSVRSRRGARANLLLHHAAGRDTAEWHAHAQSPSRRVWDNALEACSAVADEVARPAALRAFLQVGRHGVARRAGNPRAACRTAARSAQSAHSPSLATITLPSPGGVGTKVGKPPLRAGKRASEARPRCAWRVTASSLGKGRCNKRQRGGRQGPQPKSLASKEGRAGASTRRPTSPPLTKLRRSAPEQHPHAYHLHHPRLALLVTAHCLGRNCRSPA